MNGDSDNKFHKKDILFFLFFFTAVTIISVFNFIVNPYNIFHIKPIRGFNDVKIHNFTNRRTVLYTDIKLNAKEKTAFFVGNCLVMPDEDGNYDISFYTLPHAKNSEILNILHNLYKVSPGMKKIYLGIFFDDLWNENDKTDMIPEFNDGKLTYSEIINLLFSWNTLKYSIETVKESLKRSGSETEYVYPFREIAYKTYESGFDYEIISEIKKIYEFALKNDIELVVYYSPMHISKKIHIYEKGMTSKENEFKKLLADVIPYFDYSFVNDYNIYPIDENSVYYSDNVHMTKKYNRIILNDILSGNKKIPVYITPGNVDYYVKKDNKAVADFIEKNKEYAQRIKEVKPSDAGVKIPLKKN